MNQLGFGIAGAGLIAEVHAAAIAESSLTRLVAIWSRSQASAERLASRHDVPAFSDYGEFLRAPGLGAVAVCTPSGNHLEPALEAARAGKHVMVEKPIEIDLERADRIIAQCRESGVTLGVIFQSRFLRSVRQIKEAIQQGWLGEPVMGTAEVKWFRAPEYYAPGGWHGTLALDGGGALINQAIHTIDLLLWLMGPVESVQAYTARRRYPHIEGEDTAVAALRFGSGALGSIVGATSVYPGFSRILAVHGSRGTLVLEGTRIGVARFEDRALEEQFVKPEEVRDHGVSDPRVSDTEPHRLQYEDFAQAVFQNRPPAIDGPEGRRSLELVRAIYESAERGTAVVLS